jgi:hypothetical protein
MASEVEPRRGMGCPQRLLLLLVAVAAPAVPVYLLLPDAWITWELSFLYPRELYDLTDPSLLSTYKLIHGVVVGLIFCVGLSVVLAKLRQRRRVAAELAVPEPLRALRQAVASWDEFAVEQAADNVAATLGDEAIPDLLAALNAGFSADTRRQVAAALYRLGRVVTADVDLHPRT